ncbi:MAG: TRAP transporter small permease [Deltaproteobacteria bacterium]|nr:MAG: TRAP transporter small permease [Deltaproteobacteria bacterium]UCF46216.1 MAG: TRAP transporter small permease [Myxococcales bacterium]
MAEPGKEDPYKGRFGIIRRIDDWIFTVEMAILWTFLGVSAVMVFLDVMYRRLAAPDSKVAELTARIFGIESPEAMETLTTVGPIVTGIIGVGLVYFAFWTAEARGAEPGKRSRVKPIIETIIACAALGVLGWIMIQPEVESRWFYLLLYSLCGGFWLFKQLKERAPGWIMRLVAFVIVTAVFVQITLKYFPDGYSWSKEISLIMLLWVGFLGASVCAHEGKHIQVGALKRVVPPSMSRWTEAIGYLATAAFCLFMALLGWEYAKEALQLEGRFEQTNIPDWVATIAVPAAFAMTMIRYVAAAISAILGGSYGAAPEEEAMIAATQASKKGAEG